MRRLILLGVSALALVVLSPFLWALGRLTWARVAPPTSILAAFTSPDLSETAEDQLTDPLVLAGSRVVPVTLAAIADTAMPFRRYAISFLGQAGDPAAMPPLRAILADSSERDFYRGDALLAVFQLDTTRGKLIADSFASRSDYLGTIAKEILSDAPYFRQRRTFAQAFWHIHE